MQQRKKYTKEFKLDAVSLVTDQGYSRIEAARSLGINAQMLGRWVKPKKISSIQGIVSNQLIIKDIFYCSAVGLIHRMGDYSRTQKIFIFNRLNFKFTFN